jgi:hypothetical protein
MGGASNGNVVRANRLNDNNLENAVTHDTCNLMVNGNATDNTVADNEVFGKFGVGIMIGPGTTTTGNCFLQNRPELRCEPVTKLQSTVVG